MAEAIASQSNTERFRYIDVYKGLAILGVIVTHLVLMQNGTNGSGVSPWVQFLFSGLIMFMVISGLFYRPGRGYVENVRRRVLPLVVIYVLSGVVLTVLLYLYLLALGYDLSQYSLLAELGDAVIGKGCFLDVNSPEFIDIMDHGALFSTSTALYYLIILSGGYLIFYAIAERALKDWRVAVLSILVLLAVESVYIALVHIQLPFYIHLYPMVAAFLLLGALLGKHHFVEFLENGLRNRRYWITLTVLIVIAAVCLMAFPAATNLRRLNIGDYGLFTGFTFALTTLSCGFVQMYIVVILSKIPGLSHVFALMGANILYLFLLHIAVAKVLVAPFVQLVDTYEIPLEFLPAIGVTLATIAIILVMAHIYRRICPRSPPKRPTCG